MANIMEYSLLNSITTNFKTNNIIIDSILILMISSFIMNISNYNCNSFYKIKIFFESLWKNHSKITYNCKKEAISYESKSIMHFIKEAKNKDIKFLKEIQNSFYDYDIDNTNYNSYLVIDNCDSVKIYEDIYVNINHHTEELKGATVTNKIEYFNLIIFSKKHDIYYIKNFVKTCKEKYDLYLLKQIYKGQLFFNCNYDSTNKKMSIKKYSFNTNKTFNNIFFKNKEIIKNKIDFFVNNKSWYEKRGIPYTLGILLHGTPGCGKTSFIKALLKDLNKHAISINLENIDLDNLQDLILNDKLSDYPIKQEDRIYIFEDIDCMGEITHKRKEKSKKKNEDSEKTTENSEKKNDTNLKDIMKKMTTMVNKENTNNLSKLLNIIDGLIESPGRIIIMTTNHPEKLDKALIRPGRIDISIEFTKCDKYMTIDIINNYYESNLDYDYPINEYKYTPAELYQLCSYNTLDIILKKL